MTLLSGRLDYTWIFFMFSMLLDFINCPLTSFNDINTIIMNKDDK